QREVLRHDAMQGHEHSETDAIASHLPDEAMKTLVASGDVGKRTGLEMAFHVADGFLELQKLVFGVAAGGAGGKFRLENSACFIDFAEGNAVDDQKEIEWRAQG